MKEAKTLSKLKKKYVLRASINHVLIRFSLLFLLLFPLASCQAFTETIGPFVCPEGTEIYVESSSSGGETEYEFYCETPAGTPDIRVNGKVMLIILALAFGFPGLFILIFVLKKRRKNEETH